MMHERMSNEAFFALPEAPFGMVPLKEEGAPLYTDKHGYLWSLQEDYEGNLCREMLV